MSTLALVKPLSPLAVTPTQPTLNRLFTPDPKEAAIITQGSSYSVVMDFGAPVTADCAFLGYHSATADQQWRVFASDASGTAAGDLFAARNLAPLGYGPPNHAFYRAAAPITSRYWTLVLTLGPGGRAEYAAGVFALGLAFQVQYGTEWGGGRSIDDTGTVERLFGGGFAIDEGVGAGGYQWTFGDLQDAEIRQLYQLVKERRTTRSILVVEDPDQTDGLNERIHWGLFRKLDVYERRDVANTRWALQVTDWA